MCMCILLVPVPPSRLYSHSVFQLFDKILIANRGEIACRVSEKTRTCNNALDFSCLIANWPCFPSDDFSPVRFISKIFLVSLHYLQVMKTCKRLGIKTVAVYSEADANAVSSGVFWLKISAVTIIIIFIVPCPKVIRHFIIKGLKVRKVESNLL